MRVQKPREIAASILLHRERGAGYVEDLLARKLEQPRLSPVDRALAQELAYGVVRSQATLDWLINRKTSGRVQKVILQVLLRLGLYQMFWLDRIPDHAAVNETVLLVRHFGCGAQAGFVNAVLRAYGREKDATRQLLATLKVEDPALGYSHPAWLVERWTKQWGSAATTKLMEWNNSAPTTYARVNTLRASPSDLLERWREEGVDYDFGRWDWVPENLVFQLKSHPPLALLPSFRKGWFYLQDPSTLLAVCLLNPQPGDTVLDCCAAPGGKTSFIAQQMGNQGTILAEDSSLPRLDLLAENCVRLGVTCVKAIKIDPVSLPTSRPSEFSKVLVDAPCSNTGVLRRRVDLRWRIQPEELSRLQGRQLALLREAAVRLKASGVLVYSTCSLEAEENRAVVAAFLQEHPQFSLKAERELLPWVDGVDGAYVARLVKQA